MEFVKKQSVSTWVSLGACLLGIVAAIIYGVNIAKPGYFMDMSVTAVVVCSILAIIFLAGIIALAQFKFDGVIGKVLDVIADALKIVVPVLLAIALITLISNRVEGLSYLYFSNPDVLATIQTPANMSSASTAIASFVMYGIAMVAAMVAAFFGLRKKEA